MAKPNSTPQKRIIVALDSSNRGAFALAAASRLASEWSAELRGLFIEDPNLLRLAALPCTSEIDSTSGILRILNTSSIARALERRAVRARQEIVEAAQRTRLDWSFRILQTTMFEAISTAWRDAELVLIGRDAASYADTAGAEWIMVVDEGTDADSRIVSTAMHLARDSSSGIIRLLTENGARPRGPQPPIDSVTQRCRANPEAILSAVGRWRPQLVLLSGSSKLVTELQSLIARTPCTLGLVR